MRGAGSSFHGSAKLGARAGLGETSRSGGFTLLELLVVMMLLGILAALMVPQLGGTLDDARLRATSRELAATFRYAASLAITTGEPHRVRISDVERRFWVEGRLRPEDGGVRARGPVDRWERRRDGAGELPGSLSFAVGPAGEDGGAFLARGDASRGASRSGPRSLPGASRGERSPRGTALGEIASSDAGGAPAADAAAIQFFPDGSTEGATILLRDRAGDGLRVDVAPRTARVRVTRLEPELGRRR